MSGHNVVITARSFRRCSPEPKAILERAGCVISQVASPQPLASAAMIPLVRDADALIVGTDEVSAAVLDAAPHLKVVAKFGVGFDNIDVEAARRRGIQVTYTPGATSDAVADLAMGLILALARQIPLADTSVKTGRWDRPASVGVWRKTLGIVGLGGIGKALAKRARGFEMRILAFDTAPDITFVREHEIRMGSLDTLLREADFVSIHVPLTPQTRGLIGERQLRLMKRTAFLINAARGGLVDEDALTRVLREGAISGAALDVFVHEPPLDSPLLALPNVILTPHMAGDTPECTEGKGLMSAGDVARVLQGLPPLYPCPEV